MISASDTRRSQQLTGAITAPVAASWAAPAWTANVPKPRAKDAACPLPSVPLLGPVMFTVLDRHGNAILSRITKFFSFAGFFEEEKTQQRRQSREDL